MTSFETLLYSYSVILVKTQLKHWCQFNKVRCEVLDHTYAD